MQWFDLCQGICNDFCMQSFYIRFIGFKMTKDVLKINQSIWYIFTNYFRNILYLWWSNSKDTNLFHPLWNNIEQNWARCRQDDQNLHFFDSLLKRELNLQWEWSSLQARLSSNVSRKREYFWDFDGNAADWRISALLRNFEK